MKCRCGGLVFINHYYKLIKDTDYDALEAPVDEDKISNLFLEKGITAYRCSSCGRLIVEWDDEDGPTFYLPERNRAEVPEPEAGLAKHDRHNDERSEKTGDTLTAEYADSDEPDNPQLKKLEAIAEAAYSEMYDSSYPTGRYSEAKEAFYDAISLARELGRPKDVERLEKRLEHVKDVFRHQFT
jgi:hypothetical protein